MKLLPIFAILLVTTSQSFGGVLGWITSETQNWKFIQSVGGIDIDPVIQMNGKSVLPVNCDVSGLSTVTCKPTTMNSGIVIRTFEVKHTDKDITIRVITSVPEGTKASSRNYIDLSDLQKGAYQVYYETPGDPEKRLGAIKIE